MEKLIGVATAVLGGPLLFAVAVAVLATGQPPAGAAPTDEGRADIPAALLPIYIRAARDCPGLSWSVVAAIGKVETDHGRLADARLLSDGRVEPEIIGIALDGTRGTRAIPDSDAGRWDRDLRWDRAVGPMQFIPSTWRRYGLDATGDRIADPHNYLDAAASAVAYLCAHGAGNSATLRQAILAYNHAGWYADEVLATAQGYATPTASDGGGQLVGDYALPVDRAMLSAVLIRRPHHDYPAWDLPLPVGTPVYAAAAGTVTAVTDDGRCGRGVVIAGADGSRYTYCHAQNVTVTPGQLIAAGTFILRSGNTGRSTGPHLHFQIRSTNGPLVCPQPLLEAWYHGTPATPSTAPTSGCTT